MFIVSAILFTTVSHSSYGTQTTGPNTELVINTDNGVFVSVFTVENTFEFATNPGCFVFSVNGVAECVAWLPGSDAILIGTDLSTEADKYFIRSQKLNDLCPAPVFRNTDTHFG